MRPTVVKSRFWAVVASDRFTPLHVANRFKLQSKEQSAGLCVLQSILSTDRSVEFNLGGGAFLSIWDQDLLILHARTCSLFLVTLVSSSIPISIKHRGASSQLWQNGEVMRFSCSWGFSSPPPSFHPPVKQLFSSVIVWLYCTDTALSCRGFPAFFIFPFLPKPDLTVYGQNVMKKKRPHLNDKCSPPY